MRREISPVVTVVILIVVIAILVLGWYFFYGPKKGGEPPAVQQSIESGELQDEGGPSIEGGLGMGEPGVEEQPIEEPYLEEGMEELEEPAAGEAEEATESEGT